MQPHEHCHDHCEHGHSHDKRFQEFLTGVHSGDPKKTLKQIRKALKKGVPQTDSLLFRVVEAMALHKTGENPQAQKALLAISSELVHTPDLDEHVINIYMYAAKMLGMREHYMETLESLCKARPKDDGLAERLFSEYVASDRFHKLNLLAKDLEARTKKEEYTLFSTYSLYMFAKYANDSNSPIAKAYVKLATMELTKCLAARKIPADQLPANIYDLYRQILLMSDSHADALKMISSQKLIPPSTKTDHECQELKELKQYADCVNVLLSSVFANLQKGQKAEYAHETVQRLITLLISYYCSTLKDPAEVSKLSFKEQWDARADAKVTLDVPKLDSADVLLKRLFQTFATISSVGKIGDISMPLSELRSSYMSLLLMLHKIFLLDVKGGWNDAAKGIAATMAEVVKQYGKRFAATTSVYNDIIPYCIDLDPAQREELIKVVKEAADTFNKPDADYTKYIASNVLYYKLKVTLSVLAPAEMTGILTEVSTLYQAAIKKIDKKLEKGERHPADELVLVADYLLEALLAKNAKPGVMGPSTTLRILVLDYGHRHSPYNFDLTIQLLKLLIQHNLHYMAAEVYDRLRIKGVLTETLAYIYEKYLIEHVHVDKMVEVIRKFEKFSMKNSEELQGIKVKALRECNFAQAEEFYQYEQHHINSLHKIVTDTAGTFLDYLQNAGTRGQSIMLTVMPKVVEHLAVLGTQGKPQKNQDVYTLQPKLKRVPMIAELSEQIKSEFKMAPENSWENLMLDPVLLPYMSTGRTNYKENIANVYGILELPQLDMLLHTLCLIAGRLFDKNFATLKSDVENFDKLYSSFQAIAKKAPESKTFSEYSAELEDISGVFNIINQMLKIVWLMHEISTAKNQAVTEKNIASALASLKLIQEQMSRITSTFKDLLAKHPQDKEHMWTVVTEQHPLLYKGSMRRTMQLLEYLTTGGCLMLSVLKQGLPGEILKRQKKGEAAPGEALRKGLVQLKKDICAMTNEVLAACKGFKLGEEAAKWVQTWQSVPEELMKNELVQSAVSQPASVELVKKVREDMTNSILHVDIVFQPILKALSGIDIQLSHYPD